MSVPPLTPGQEIGAGYEVIEHLRRGNALDVYDVWSDERGCRCIVKAVRLDRLEDDGPRRRLLEEGRLLERLTHPHIVRAYETIESPVPLIVMETLTGETLSHLIEGREALLEPAELGHLGMHLASAVRYLHGHRYLHLDLKPSNVIAEGGRAKLLDLSIARPPGPARAGIGTMYYMAPEQVRGGVLSAAADVWGLGVVLYEAAVGEPAFGDPEEEDLDDEDLEGEDPDGSEVEDSYGDGEYLSSEDEPYATDADPSLDQADYPQLHHRAARVSDHRTVPVSLDDLIAACLDPEEARRPSLGEVLAALEVIAGTPSADRRHGRTSAGVTPPSERPTEAAPDTSIGEAVPR